MFCGGGNIPAVCVVYRVGDGEAGEHALVPTPHEAMI